MAVIFSLAVIPASADPASELREQIKEYQDKADAIEKDIKNLQSQKKEQQKLKALYEEQMALLQSQIDLCNSKIRESNAKIAKNEAEILEKQKEMEAAINEFKLRIRAIYMSGGTGSGLEILMGADDFSDFIALSQLTQNVSKRDKKMIDDISEMIAEVNEKIKENEALIATQKEIRATLDEKHDEYDKKVASVQSIISGLESDEDNLSDDLDDVEDDIKEMEEELDSILNPPDENIYTGDFEGKTFIWPVPGYLGITSKYGPRWGKTHKGIDIASGGIRGKAAVASASGTVVKVVTGCKHNYGNSAGYKPSPKCGGGYGNYVVVAHGKLDGTYYQTLYAHLGSVAVSKGQYVKQGQVVGYVGSTGNSTGWHLHFEVQKSSNGKSYSHTNPLNYVSNTK